MTGNSLALQHLRNSQLEINLATDINGDYLRSPLKTDVNIASSILTTSFPP
ncbi:MAG: hypothetical protein SAK29_10880 [Scytonema sp. PMC 1069.18]|nr:hypothetical protein [Scytonema sp. PMC 1069.18]